MPAEIRFAKILEQLLNERYKRNRAELALKAHISPSALSQYVRDRATPSLEVLAHLAEALDVSIDYLVFGRNEQSLSADTGYLTSQLESGIRKSQTDAAELYDLVARVGDRLGKVIKQTAEELLPESAGGAGQLFVDEVKLLETCSAHTTIVTSSLDTEVAVYDTPGKREASAPGAFADVIVTNLERNRGYEYFVPVGRELARRSDQLRGEVRHRSSLTQAAVDRLLKVHQVPQACAPGYIVHEIVVADLQHSAPSIYDRVAPFMSAGTSRPGHAHVVTLEPASRSYRHFGILDVVVLPAVLAGLDELRKSVGSREGRPTRADR